VSKSPTSGEAANNLFEHLRKDGLLSTSAARLTPLTGGVSSEIYRVDDGDKAFVVKRALEKLNVKDEWHADVIRNHYEHEFIRVVSDFVPDSVPKLLHVNDAAGYFAMEWLGTDLENWKTRLLAGDARPSDSQRAGALLGSIHHNTTGNAGIRSRFETTENFRKLRLDPYLIATALKHPDLNELILKEVERIATTRECLVHGDFSPKNILLNDDRLVILDCEVAWYGDPRFDVAFLLNHHFLKALYHSPVDVGLLPCIGAVLGAYHAERQLTDAQAFDQETAQLLMMLMLARVDGKSPVEFLGPPKQETLRRFVVSRLARGWVGTLEKLTVEWFDAIKLDRAG
jgi:aminoglycoside phosphotransferase (APT) family kinase protein